MNILNYSSFKSINELNKQNRENLDFIHKSKDLVVLAPHNHKIASKYSTNTEWCSQSKSGFCMHSRDEVLFRFLFKDGYKLRLNLRKGGLVGHWGGPKSKERSYPMMSFKRNPKNIDTQIYDVEKWPSLKEMYEKIKSIPDDVMKKCIEYTNETLKEREPKVSKDVLEKIFNEIKSNKKINYYKDVEDMGTINFEIIVQYNETYKRNLNVVKVYFSQIDRKNEKYLNESFKILILDDDTLMYNGKKIKIDRLGAIINSIVSKIENKRNEKV